MTGKNNLVTKAVLKQELKKLEGKLTWRMDGFDKRMDGFDKRMKDFRNELSAHKIAIELKLGNQQEETKKLITGFKDEILRAVDGVMMEIKANREERLLVTDRVYENVTRLEDHESRIKILEQNAATL